MSPESVPRTAVVLAAGLGTRMGGKPKPLLRVGGREIIYRNMKLLEKNGIENFVVVVNNVYGKNILDFLKNEGFEFKCVVNPEPERGNGYSLYLARELVDERFVLVMGDHVYGEEFIDKAVRAEGLVGDANPKFVDIEEATKVKVENGRAMRVGKDLNEFDCIDTGFFVLTPEIFDVAEQVVNEGDAISLSRIMEKARVPVTLVSGNFWMDVDTEEELKRANREIVKRSVKPGEDGIISRHLNRKISVRISERLVERVTPNQATLLSFIFGVISILSIFISKPLSGILFQLSSILDGIDGEIARVRMMGSPFGGWIDSNLDRIVDFFFLLTLALTSNLDSFGWALFSLSVFGSYMVSYTSERYRGAFGRSIYEDFPQLRKVPGKRDERIFITMLFLLINKPVMVFAVLAFLTNFKVALTLLTVWSGSQKYRKE